MTGKKFKDELIFMLTCEGAKTSWGKIELVNAIKDLYIALLENDDDDKTAR